MSRFTKDFFSQQALIPGPVDDVGTRDREAGLIQLVWKQSAVGARVTLDDACRIVNRHNAASSLWPGPQLWSDHTPTFTTASLNHVMKSIPKVYLFEMPSHKGNLKHYSTWFPKQGKRLQSLLSISIQILEVFPCFGFMCDMARYQHWQNTFVKTNAESLHDLSCIYNVWWLYSKISLLSWTQ